MSEWTDRLAEALTVEPLDPDDETRLLDASREIAHRVERKDTPLSSFLMGVAVGSMTAGGMTRDEAIDDVFEDLARILPDLPDLPAGPA